MLEVAVSFVTKACFCSKNRLYANTHLHVSTQQSFFTHEPMCISSTWHHSCLELLRGHAGQQWFREIINLPCLSAWFILMFFNECLLGGENSERHSKPFGVKWWWRWNELGLRKEWILSGPQEAQQMWRNPSCAKWLLLILKKHTLSACHGLNVWM